MAKNSNNMGLYEWNAAQDPYDPDELVANWEMIDQHDHSPGRGVQIGMAGIAPGAVGPVQLAASAPVVPTGGIILWGNSVAPAGFLLCDGNSYSTTVYAALYAVVGTSYGSSGAGTFAVPAIGPTALSQGSAYYIIKT